METKKIARRLNQMAKVMQEIIKEVDQENSKQSCWINHIEDTLSNLKGWIELMEKEADEEVKNVYRYEGTYGILEIDVKRKKVIKDELNRKRIWDDAKDSYLKRHNIYASIIEELLGEDIQKIFPPIYQHEKWHGKAVDTGFKAINDEIELVVDEEGTFIYDKEQWILSYVP